MADCLWVPLIGEEERGGKGKRKGEAKQQQGSRNRDSLPRTGENSYLKPILSTKATELSGSSISIRKVGSKRPAPLLISYFLHLPSSQHSPSASATTSEASSDRKGSLTRGFRDLGYVTSVGEWRSWGQAEKG